MIHKEFILVFNGEIYNYKESQRSRSFDLVKNISDPKSEVILKLYLQKGVDSFSELDGMFAFSIYDREKKEVFSARDRLGVKPFYYSWDKGVFEICSQIKPLAENKTIDQEAIEIYLQTGYVPSPWSIYKEAKKLKPGFIMTMKLDSQDIEFEQYWELQTPTETEYLILRRSKRRITSAVKGCCENPSNNRCTLGSLLTGGIDSALVSAIANKEENGNLKTFTIGFDNPEYDESTLAGTFSEIIGSDHQETICSAKDLIDCTPHLF